MKIRLVTKYGLAVLAVVVLGGAQLNAAEQAMALSAESIISQYQNSSDKPPEWGHYKKWSTDALLMGNGDMGLSVGGEAESLRFWINKNDFWRLQNQHLGAQPKLFGWIDIKAPALQGASYKSEQPLYKPITHGTFLRNLEAWTKQKSPDGMKHGNHAHGVESCTPSIITINLMLCTGHQDVLRVFHAWPNELDAAFENLRAEGAFLVSSRLSKGTVEYVEITSERGRACTLQNPWPGQSVAVTRGDGRTEALAGERFTFQTGTDETLRLVPQG